MQPGAGKRRIAFVVHRYGDQITGGAEAHCRQIAERMARYYEVEVLTTTALDHLSWKNVLPAGRDELNGVVVRRFPSATERNLVEFHKIYDRIFLTQLTPEEEYEMLRHQGPNCPKLIEYLRNSADRYGAFVFFTYMYYPTCLGLPLVKSKAAFVPTAHDETSLYMHLLDDLFRQTPFLLFNSHEERHLLQRRFNLPAGVGRVVGMGVEPTDPGPPDAAWPDLAERIGASRVLAYLGRVENGKGCDELVDFFLRYVEKAGCRNLLLLLVGRRTLPIPDHPQILSTGYVSEYLKQQLLRRADIVVASSPFESLSLTALEALLFERPLLVNGHCPVLVGHCLRSNGGLWYRDFEEFSEALATLLDDPELRRAMGAQGRRYVEENYRWETVEQAYREVLEAIIAGGAGGREGRLG
jgi:glycosyltransferase involved in cell wall biosynthesis